jgi:lysophospholipid acyltransferase (LPLAT)-like uncharacterized protein
VRDVTEASPTPAPRARRIEKPRTLKWHHHVAAFLIFAGLRTLSATWRCRLHDEHGTYRDFHQPAIFSLWHNRLALSMLIWQRYARPRLNGGGLVALISASHDGGMLARALRYFGVDAARGSSSRRGAQALLELTSWIERGHAVAITPDGPRGPRYRVHDGIIALAQLSSLPIIPVSVFIHPKIQLRSWDKFQIPLPFARCDIHVGATLAVPRELTEEQRQALKEELRTRMMTMTRDE